MPITSTSLDDNKVSSTYVGRVLEVRTFRADLNLSDILDYTVTCKEALVWLGTHGHPGNHSWNEPRSLEFHEQFVWVDVSNHFSWRNREVLTAEVDAVQGVSGEPIMWANLIAWRNHVANQELIADREAADREAAERAEKARKAAAAKAAKLAAKEAKDAVAKAAVEAAQGVKVPPNGTAVRTSDGFVGKVFWSGTKKYRGTWSVRLGVKDSKGMVAWCGVDDVTLI